MPYDTELCATVPHERLKFSLAKMNMERRSNNVEDAPAGKQRKRTMVKNGLKNLGRNIRQTISHPFKRTTKTTAICGAKLSRDEESILPNRVVNFLDATRDNPRSAKVPSQRPTIDYQQIEREKKKVAILEALQRATRTPGPLKALKPTLTTVTFNATTIGLLCTLIARYTTIPWHNVDHPFEGRPSPFQALLLPSSATSTRRTSLTSIEHGDSSSDEEHESSPISSPELSPATTPETRPNTPESILKEDLARVDSSSLLLSDPLTAVEDVFTNREKELLSAIPVEDEEEQFSDEKSEHPSEEGDFLTDVKVRILEDRNDVASEWDEDASKADEADPEDGDLAFTDDDIASICSGDALVTFKGLRHPKCRAPLNAEAIESLGSLQVASTSDPNSIVLSYPPKGFFVMPSEYDDYETDSKRVAKARAENRQVHAQGNVHGRNDEVPEYLRGLMIDEKDQATIFGFRSQCTQLCNVGDCTCIGATCYPHKHFFDLSKMVKDAGLKVAGKNMDELHVLLWIEEPEDAVGGILGYPPYNELEVHSTTIIAPSDTKNKNEALEDWEHDTYPYLHNLEHIFKGCPIRLHCNVPLVDFALSYRIEDILSPRFESVVPPMMAEYLNGKTNAMVQRTSASKPALQHYRSNCMLGNVVRLKVVPQYTARVSGDNETDDATDVGMLAFPAELPTNCNGTFYETVGLGPSSFMELQPWSSWILMRLCYDGEASWDTGREFLRSAADEWKDARRRAHTQGQSIHEIEDMTQVHCYWHDAKPNAVMHSRDDTDRSEWEGHLHRMLENNPNFAYWDRNWDPLTKTFVRIDPDCEDKEDPAYDCSENGFVCLAYDNDKCMCDRIDVECLGCREAVGATKANVWLINKWVDEVEEKGRDPGSNKWIGDAGVVDEAVVVTLADVPPGDMEYSEDYKRAYYSKLHASLETPKTREEGGLVRYFPKWLNTAPQGDAQHKFVHLPTNANDTTEVIAKAVSSTQRLKLIFVKSMKLLVLIGDIVDMLEIVGEKVEGEVLKNVERAAIEHWWEPNLMWYGIPCKLKCNLPITKMTIVETGQEADGGQSFYLPPGRPDSGDAEAWNTAKWSVYPGGETIW